MQTLIGVVFTERPGEVCEGHILIGHNYCQSCRVRKNWPVTAGDITVIITTSQSPPSRTLSYTTHYTVHSVHTTHYVAVSVIFIWASHIYTRRLR